MEINNLSSFYNEFITDISKQTQSDSKLDKSLSADFTNPDEKQLLNACKEFEAYFVEQVFKEMQKTIPKQENQSESTSKLVDYFEESTIQELSTQTTENNSLGLAQMLFEQMKRNYDL